MLGAESLEPPFVLLLDDDPAVARAHARWLKRSGLRIEVCGAPLLALERIAAEERFDVVVWDGQMPDREGVAFYVEACAAWPELARRIVFLSGGLPEKARRFIDRQGLPFFSKPLVGRSERDEILAVIRTLARPGVVPLEADWRKRYIPR